MRTAVALVAAGLALAGCKTDSAAFHQPPPPLSLVGEGLSVDRAPLPARFTQPERRSFHSLYNGTNGSLFRDLRARKVGDTVTVTIDINDNAQFDNQSGHSREGETKGAFAGSLEASGFKAGTLSADTKLNGDLSGSTESKGSGTIDRSEKLHLAIAAVVVEVLPDGNLFISGSQEVRVNREVRVLNIAGIVRPLDIGGENTVAYDKIAEARISYGGRGKLSDVQ
jgi:flagellar L-ring protein precursor FlgH